MATIKLTEPFVVDLIPTILKVGTMTLQVYKGTKPSDFSTEWINTSSRSSDLLLTFSMTGSQLIQEGTKVRIVDYIVTTATATGTAAWFVLSSSFANTTAILGTVTVTGSIGDLIIGNTNIVSGDYYDLVNCYFEMPTEYIY